MTTIEKTKPNEQKVIDALAVAEEATVDEVAAAAGIGRTSARKYLSALVDADKARRIAGGRDGKRKLPDRFSLFSDEAEPAAGGKAEGSSGGGSTERLRPGGLDDLVLAYMREHREGGPFGPTAVAKGLGRSSGAVGNCLARLASVGEKVTKVGERPRRYTLKEGA